MRVFDGVAKTKRLISSAGTSIVVLAFVIALSISGVRAQAPPAKGATGDSAAAAGFSIETEMLTYRALESNGKAVACDIAAYLSGANSTSTSPPVGSLCDAKPATDADTVVLLPFESTELTDFQIWRADMATMARLQKKANTDCPTPSANASDSTNTNPLISQFSYKPAAQSAPSQAAAATSSLTAGSPLAIAQSVLALMAKDESSSPVGGTIRDQAFMDGVGRELRELGVPVLMPTAYTPHSLSMLDESTSPFLAALDAVLKDRRRCEVLASDNVKREDNKKSTKQGMNDSNNPSIYQRMIGEIDAFLNTLSQGAVLAPQGTKPEAGKTQSGGASAQRPAGAGSSGEVPAAPQSSSHLNAVLLADGLAWKLGVDPSTGSLPPKKEASLHILLVSALESGGSVTRFSNIFGTTIRYSGGSVGTYALFRVDGDLECSGNVYEYGGSLRAKDFRQELGKYSPDPAAQMVSLRHCRQQTQK